MCDDHHAKINCAAHWCTGENFVGKAGMGPYGTAVMACACLMLLCSKAGASFQVLNCCSYPALLLGVSIKVTAEGPLMCIGAA